MDKVRFGIVGLGNMGTGHANNFLAGKIKNGYITAVCDVNPDKFGFLKKNLVILSSILKMPRICSSLASAT